MFRADFLAFPLKPANFKARKRGEIGARLLEFKIMDSFQQEISQAFKGLDRIHVDFTKVGDDPEIIIKARIRGGSTGLTVEVFNTAIEYRVSSSGCETTKIFGKNELSKTIEYVKDILKT